MVDTSRIVLVDKPTGMTSFAVASFVGKRLGKRKVGHAGTLDPLATGLLLLGVGQGTKDVQNFVKLDKSYDVEAVFGYSTTTADADGDPIDVVSPDETKRVLVQMADARGESLENLMKEIVTSIVGVNRLAVPAYSAVKKNGQSLHKFARRGEEIELPIRDMKVYSARFDRMEENEYGYPSVIFSVDVASGVYVRSLVEEMGRKLGCYAHVRSLRRTRVGDFDVKDAVEPEKVAEKYSHIDFDSK